MKHLALLLIVVSAIRIEAKNYVAFVNTGACIDQALFEEVVTNDLRVVLAVDGHAETAERVDVSALVKFAASGYPKSERQLAVYFVDSPEFPPQLTIPQHAAVINVRGLRKGADDKLYRKRILKMMLKGLAFSCGFGATMERGVCVMGVGSFDTLTGIDETSDSYSPFCLFPLEKYLNQRGLMWVDPEFE